MKIYELHLNKPKWFFDSPTNRQIKVLRFFNIEIPANLTKGAASGIIAELLRSNENKELWQKYVYYTGDESQESPELCPYDIAQLQTVVVPDDWQPTTAGTSVPSERQKRLRALITEMLREGSPFDDPVPKITFAKARFAFTGKFTSGSRKECQEAVKKLGAEAQKEVTTSTDFLVIGNEGSENWAQGSHGRKIERAMILRMETNKPEIISESDWVQAIQQEPKS